ncbi:hypothetical protein K435DRAFT_698128, partial [Dendrothele bispora CBS 962.96]
PPFALEAIRLLFNVAFIKPCVIGFSKAHGNATKWQLASEINEQTKRIRLEFNSNPRFLASSKNSKFGPTGLLANVIMAISLAVTYAASQTILLEIQEDNVQPGEPVRNTLLSYFAFLVLGVVILIQASISVWALTSTKIRSWNTSPFAAAYILSQLPVEEGETEKYHLKRTPGRCMRSLYDRFCDSADAVVPRKEQVSAWDSHPIFRSLTMWIWMLIGAGFYWGILIFSMVQSGTTGTSQGGDWLPVSISSNSSSPSVLNLGWDGVAPTSGLLWGLAILVGFQGGIVTTALTCAQTILDLACDQQMWMEIEKKGSDSKPHIFKKYVVCWHSYVIQVADPLYHWMFGLAVNISANKGLQVRPVPIFWVSAVGVLGAAFITWQLKIKINTYLPATFGHLQTMVDLIDEWDEKIYWGDKSIGYKQGHAGTSTQNAPYRVVEIFKSKSYGGQDCTICHRNSWMVYDIFVLCLVDYVSVAVYFIHLLRWESCQSCHHLTM